jgi:uncharacterized membrane protein YeaQ/YmgE (transglycosylase-associated protein family)
MPSTGHPHTRPTPKRRRQASRAAGATPITRNAPAARETTKGKRFDAREVLKRTGMRVADEGRQARVDLEGAGRAAKQLGTVDEFGDAGTFLLGVVGSILALVLLQLLIGNRGSSITSAALRWFGSGINRLVSPTDPLVFGGQGTTVSSPALAGAGTPGTVDKNGNPVTSQGQVNPNGPTVSPKTGQPMSPITGRPPSLH